MTQKNLIQQATVEGIGNKVCFITLPQKWKSLIKPSPLPTFTIESASTSASIVSNWAGEFHFNNDDTIYVNNVLLKSNGFEEGEDVYVSQVPTPSPCLHMFAELNSVDDWDNIVLNYESIQLSMLDQVRIVQIGQFLPLWLEGGCFVLLKIHSFEDSMKSIHILANDTTINIAPPKVPSVNQLVIPPIKPLATTMQKDNLIEKLIKFDVFNLVITSFRRTFPQLHGNCFPQKAYIYEVLSFKSFPNDNNDSLIEQLRYHPALAIVSKSIVVSSTFENSNWFVTNIERVKTGKVSNDEKSKSQNILKTVCLAIVWENFSSEKGISEAVQEKILNVISNSSCIVSDPLKANLGLLFSDVIQLDSANVKMAHKNASLDVCPISDTPIVNDDIISSLKSFIKTMCNICPIVLSDTTVISVPVSDNNVQVLLKTKTTDFIDRISCSLVSFHLITKPIDIVLPQLMHSNIIAPVNKDRTTLYNEFLNTLLLHIQKDLTSCDFMSKFLLLEGVERSGKTTFAVDVMKHIQHAAIYCRLLKLKSFKGKKADILQTTLLKDIRQCLLYQPSVLILDDLDYLAPSHLLGNQDDGSLHEYITQLSIMLKNIFAQLVKMSSAKRCDMSNNFQFVIMATCKSRCHINSILSAPNGYNIFPNVFKLPLIKFEEKLTVISDYIKTNLDMMNVEYVNPIASIQFTSLNDQLKGTIQALTLPELRSFSRRVVTEAKWRWEYMNESNASLFVCKDDFINASRNIIPLCVKEINNQRKDNEKVIIGGLCVPRNIIKQSILWPLQHPRIFSQIGLNVRTGILLYGPPGCGKTLLAKSIATSYNHNFIFVKGPELLSKYIGQSEKSVRNIFNRGRNASPCIVFFDEFDALAPRRGHDNTGVLDRVVNQLLTQMDGVEGNDGISILAATSRPDLIDPALLRPGRLDKHVYCPIPDDTERAQIFEALSTHLPLTESIDWKELACLTSQLTGADIKGIFSTAQLIAAKEVLGESLYDSLNLLGQKSGDKVSDMSKFSVGCGDQVNICKRHIMEAINTTKRSISDFEIKKYENIYRKFGHNQDAKLSDVILTGNKYTLA